MSLLDVADLTLSIDGQPILRPCRCGIAPGEILALTGEAARASR